MEGKPSSNVLPPKRPILDVSMSICTYYVAFKGVCSQVCGLNSRKYLCVRGGSWEPVRFENLGCIVRNYLKNEK